MAAGIYPVIRRMGARAEQGENILKEANRGWGDSFQVDLALSSLLQQSPVLLVTFTWHAGMTGHMLYQMCCIAHKPSVIVQVATGRLAFIVLAGTILAEATTGKVSVLSAAPYLTTGL